MRGYQLRKYRRLLYRAFPTLVYSNRKAYSMQKINSNQEDSSWKFLGYFMLGILLFILLLGQIIK